PGGAGGGRASYRNHPRPGRGTRRGSSPGGRGAPDETTSEERALPHGQGRGEAGVLPPHREGRRGPSQRVREGPAASSLSPSAPRAFGRASHRSPGGAGRSESVRDGGRARRELRLRACPYRADSRAATVPGVQWRARRSSTESSLVGRDERIAGSYFSFHSDNRAEFGHSDEARTRGTTSPGGREARPEPTAPAKRSEMGSEPEAGGAARRRERRAKAAQFLPCGAVTLAGRARLPTDEERKVDGAAHRKTGGKGGSPRG
ncbi:hypothetical protein THAOC_36849, partial [Thalassiosira oceanica]